MCCQMNNPQSTTELSVWFKTNVETVLTVIVQSQLIYRFSVWAPHIRSHSPPLCWEGHRYLKPENKASVFHGLIPCGIEANTLGFLSVICVNWAFNPLWVFKTRLNWTYIWQKLKVGEVGWESASFPRFFFFFFLLC